MASLFRACNYSAVLCKGARSFASVSHNQVCTIRPGIDEVNKFFLRERNLERAVRHLHRDGLVVIENAVPHAHIDALNDQMVKDARTLQDRGENGPFNYNKGNIQLDAPPVSKFFFPSILANPIATQVTSAVLGPRPKWTFCSANAAMAKRPGIAPQRQPVHSDADFAHPDHPFALVVNVPLVDTSPDNGSTEVWLGTHNETGLGAQEGAHGERASGRVREDLLAHRAKTHPPLQPTIKKGSLVIRDLRLWHAGMPNHTEQTRVMIALIHFAPWYRNMMKLELGEDVKPILEEMDRGARLGLDVPVNWVATEEAWKSYLDRGFGNSYDFDQEP